MSAPARSPFMQILNGFAQVRHRLDRWTEKEVHPFGDRPVGSGWVCTSSDHIEAVWERKHVTEVPL